MKSLRFLDRRAGYSLGAIGLMLGIVAPAAIPAFASANSQITSRSIAMTSNAVSATGVSYELKYTAAAAVNSGGLIEVDFCDDSPVIGNACGVSTRVPTTTAVTLTSMKKGATDISASASVAAANSNHSIALTVGTTGYSASDNIDIVFGGLVNPGGTAGTFYARVVTYTSANKTQYSAPDDIDADPNDAHVAESGAVALTTEDTVGVTAYVQESMTFCISGVNPTGNCGTLDPGSGAVAVTSPSMTLGEDLGNGSKALESNHTSTGDVYAQLSTNAANGAVVNLQSDATSCGGLYLNGDTTKCNIAPNTDHTVNFSDGTADFGVKVGTATTAGGATDATGDLTPANNYSSSVYYMDYAAGNTAGVTSPYGSAIFQSGSTPGPVSNKNIPLTFGASINNNTPAGKYGATLRLNATGTF